MKNTEGFGRTLPVYADFLHLLDDTEKIAAVPQICHFCIFAGGQQKNPAKMQDKNSNKCIISLAEVAAF
ncbi:MAG: hypothetical protein LUG64_05445 [Clostridiales bacterium]|nr:hypothetical protein [Clostridiales bacterium]